MSVKIYKGDATNPNDTSRKGVHSLIPLTAGAYTSQCTGSSALTTITMVRNGVATAPYIPNQNITSNFVFIVCTTAGLAGEFARLMVYSDAGGEPDVLLGSLENLDLSTTGIKTGKLSVAFVAGTTYWLAIQTNSSTAVLSAIPNASLISVYNNPASGTSYSFIAATGVYASGAQDPFSNYASRAFSSASMPFIGLERGVV